MPEINPNVLLFGRHHSDYMGVVDYDLETGWSAPTIRPFEKLKLNPFYNYKYVQRLPSLWSTFIKAETRSLGDVFTLADTPVLSCNLHFGATLMEKFSAGMDI